MKWKTNPTSSWVKGLQNLSWNLPQYHFVFPSTNSKQHLEVGSKPTIYNIPIIHWKHVQQYNNNNEIMQCVVVIEKVVIPPSLLKEVKFINNKLNL